ncbi:hypothetical protein MKW98_010915 [Papaver atlanticum]|uniref:Uncharacterized protein n=1 Tax=Papaver atlanticum TaxID=357466 RepID=A0AAD4XGG8_9MAGN|nr:hypothetical protein MKW98_010915 [Papaver atlanticum]
MESSVLRPSKCDVCRRIHVKEKLVVPLVMEARQEELMSVIKLGHLEKTSSLGENSSLNSPIFVHREELETEEMEKICQGDSEGFPDMDTHVRLLYRIGRYLCSGLLVDYSGKVARTTRMFFFCLTIQSKGIICFEAFKE